MAHRPPCYAPWFNALAQQFSASVESDKSTYVGADKSKLPHRGLWLTDHPGYAPRLNALAQQFSASVESYKSELQHDRQTISVRTRGPGWRGLVRPPLWRKHGSDSEPPQDRTSHPKQERPSGIYLSSFLSGLLKAETLRKTKNKWMVVRSFLTFPLSSHFMPPIIRSLLLYIILFLPVFSAFAGGPKVIVAKGTYQHKKTKMEFPETFSGYRRVDLVSFDRKKSNICGTYEIQSEGRNTRLSVYVYPAGKGFEGRLREAYFFAEKDMIQTLGGSVSVQKKPVFYEKNGYKLAGFSGMVMAPTTSYLGLFECGQWFFKIRITSDALDSAGITHLASEVFNTWNPTALVIKGPLGARPEMQVAPAAMYSSLLLGTITGSALSKLAWARTHIDSLQRISGMPDLYLAMHVEAWNYVSTWAKKQQQDQGSDEIRQQLQILEKLIELNFLEEYLMEYYRGIMIVPEGMVLDSIGFAKWKKENPINLDLPDNLCTISFP